MTEKMAPNSLDQLRQQIDRIDDQILGLLEKRAEVAKNIGEEKRRTRSSAPGFFDPEREARNIRRLEAQAQAIFPLGSIPLVFKEIMSACRSLETDMRIAFLGPEGTFTQIAASRAFGQSVQYLEAPTIYSVFDAVQRAQAEFGVVPLENSSTGGVNETLQTLLETSLMIRGEITLAITHCLAGKNTDLGAIRKVYSHPQALAQCRDWLEQHLPRAEIIESPSTAKAACSALEDAQSAAICSRTSAERLGLRILREGVEDQNQNETRFIILAGHDGPQTGNDRTSLVFGTLDKGASFPQLLLNLEKAGIPVTRIETRPDHRKKWRTLCFVDLLGHRLEPRVKEALDRIASSSETFKILGSYPVERDRPVTG